MGAAIAVPAIASIGSSVIGGMFGKSAQKKQAKLAQQQQALQNQISQQQLAQQQQIIGMAQPFMQGSQKALSDATNWWAPLMQGNNSAINQFLAPERRAINQGYQSAMTNVARFGPRGGGQVSSLLAGDLARQGQLSDLIFNARRQAVNATTQLGQMQGAMGQGLFGLGNQSAEMASNTGLRGFDVLMESRKNPGGANMISQAGQTLGKVLSDPNLFKSKGKGSGSRGGGGSYDSGD